MHLAFISQLTSGSVTLDTDESLHVTKVLRLQLGGQIKLTDGKGASAIGTITSNAKKNVVIEVKEVNLETTCPYLFELAIAPTKSNDRFELVLEKCSELGIRKIHPIITYHSERRKLNMDRCQKILTSAMKQSQKIWLPEISNPIKFSDFVTECSTENRFIAHCEASNKRASFKQEISHFPTLLCIGPEGDFSSEEILQAEQNEFTSVHLGEERLRTETAAIFANSIFQALTL